MCAHYRLKLSLRYIAEILGMSWAEFEEFSEKPRLNIQISQRVPIVRLEDGQKKLAMTEWGFIAPWDKKTRLFNAVSETLSVKRTFGESFKLRRCLIPADGFYEWPGKQAAGSKDRTYLR
jgi:putative SOS response-associated peptidase YedK